MAIKVAGELYESVTGQLFEIGRQLRQPNGYPFDPNQLKECLQRAIEGKFNSAATLVQAEAAIFTIATGDKRSAKELLAAGKYDWVDDYARQFVEGKKFPLASKAEDVDLVLVEFGHDPESEEVLAEFKRQGLERPIAEDALRFGEKFPDEQKKYPLVFLHEPWQDPFGDHVVLVLFYDGSKRRLFYYWFDNR